jgi:hypothetical protein
MRKVFAIASFCFLAMALSPPLSAVEIVDDNQLKFEQSCLQAEVVSFEQLATFELTSYDVFDDVILTVSVPVLLESCYATHGNSNKANRYGGNQEIFTPSTGNYLHIDPGRKV